MGMEDLIFMQGQLMEKVPLGVSELTARMLLAGLGDPTP